MNAVNAAKSLNNPRFWDTLDNLVESCPIVIDRPKGQPHPRYPDLIYPLDYGYLEGTSGGDGGGIDVWIGSLGGKALMGLLCTFDPGKRDAEVKLLLGCTLEDVRTILNFNNSSMRYWFTPRPAAEEAWTGAQ